VPVRGHHLARLVPELLLLRVAPARAPPPAAEWLNEPRYDDPFPDYDTEPVSLSSEALA